MSIKKHVGALVAIVLFSFLWPIVAGLVAEMLGYLVFGNGEVIALMAIFLYIPISLVSICVLLVAWMIWTAISNARVTSRSVGHV